MELYQSHDPSYIFDKLIMADSSCLFFGLFFLTNFFLKNYFSPFNIDLIEN
jgi:hypothetical protein